MAPEEDILQIIPAMQPNLGSVRQKNSEVAESIGVTPLKNTFEEVSTKETIEDIPALKKNAEQVSNSGSSDSSTQSSERSLVSQPPPPPQSRLARRSRIGMSMPSGIGHDNCSLTEAAKRLFAGDEHGCLDDRLGAPDAGSLRSESSSYAIVGQGRLARFIGSSRFNLLIGALILANTVIMGMELDQHPIATEDGNVMIKTGMPKGIPTAVFDAFEVAFFFAFSFEFLARLAVRRCSLFREVATYVDVLALMPVVLLFAFNLHASKHLTLLRIVRLLKLLRLVRLFRVFKELRVLVASLASAMRALVWIGFLLLILVYCAAIWCTMLIGHNDSFQKTDASIISYQERWGVEVDIARYWGSIIRSMFTLFQIFTLDDWNEAVRPIIETHQPWMIVFFVTFLFTTSFGLLNLLMGTIVEHAIHRSKEMEAEKELLLEEDYNKMMLATVRLFSIMDKDGDGLLSAREIKENLSQTGIADFVENELQRVKINLDYEELIEICQLIVEDWVDPDDAENCDGIAMEEFVGAAIRLQGVAKSRDVLSVLVTAKASLCRTQACDVKIGKLRASLDEMGRRFEDKLDQVLSVLNDGGPPSHASPVRQNLKQKRGSAVKDIVTTAYSSTCSGYSSEKTNPEHATKKIQDDYLGGFFPRTNNAPYERDSHGSLSSSFPTDDTKNDYNERLTERNSLVVEEPIIPVTVAPHQSWLRADRNLVAKSGSRTVNTLMQKFTQQELDTIAGTETAGMLRQCSAGAALRHRSRKRRSTSNNFRFLSEAAPPDTVGNDTGRRTWTNDGHWLGSTKLHGDEAVRTRHSQKVARCWSEGVHPNLIS